MDFVLAIKEVNGPELLLSDWLIDAVSQRAEETIIRTLERERGGERGEM